MKLESMNIEARVPHDFFKTDSFFTVDARGSTDVYFSRYNGLQAVTANPVTTSGELEKCSNSITSKHT